MLLFSLHDKRAKVFNLPFPERSKETAIRATRGAVNHVDQTNNLYRWPQDYAVYIVGAYDETTGKLIPCEPELIVECNTLVETKKED